MLTRPITQGHTYIGPWFIPGIGLAYPYNPQSLVLKGQLMRGADPGFGPPQPSNMRVPGTLDVAVPVDSGYNTRPSMVKTRNKRKR